MDVMRQYLKLFKQYSDLFRVTSVFRPDSGAHGQGQAFDFVPSANLLKNKKLAYETLVFIVANFPFVVGYDVTNNNHHFHLAFNEKQKRIFREKNKEFEKKSSLEEFKKDLRSFYGVD